MDLCAIIHALSNYYDILKYLEIKNMLFIKIVIMFLYQKGIKDQIKHYFLYLIKGLLQVSTSNFDCFFNAKKTT